MKLIPLILTATLALTALPVFGDYAILLPEGTNVAVTLCTGSSGPTPVRCTATSLTGFSSGQTVWIHGALGNRAVNGLRKIQIINSTQFDVYTTADVAVAPNGNWVDWWTGNTLYTSRPVMSATVSYTLKDHPRTILDGPSGTMTTTLSSRALASGNDPYIRLKAILDPRLANTSYWTMPSPGVLATSFDGTEHNPVIGGISGQGAYVLSAAMAYRVTGQQKYLDYATYWLLHMDSTFSFVFDDEMQYGGDQWGADYDSYRIDYMARTYDLIQPYLSPSDDAAIRDRFLNDYSNDGSTADCDKGWIWAPDGLTVNNPHTTILPTGQYFTLTGNGTKWLTDADTNKRLNPGDWISMIYKSGNAACAPGTSDGSCYGISWTNMIRSVDSDTQVTLAKSTSQTYGGFPAAVISNTGYRIRRAWSGNMCGIGYSHKHNYTGSLTWGTQYKTFGISSSGNHYAGMNYTTDWFTSPFYTTVYDNKTGSRIKGQLSLGFATAGDGDRGDEALRLGWFAWMNQWRKRHQQRTTGNNYAVGLYYVDRFIPESVWPSWWAKNAMSTTFDSFPEKYLKFHVMDFVPDATWKMLYHTSMQNMTYTSYYFMLGMWPTLSEYRGSDWQKALLYIWKNWTGTWPGGLGADWNGGMSDAVAIYDTTMVSTNPDSLPLPHQYAFNRTDTVDGLYGTEDGVDTAISRTGFASGNTFLMMFATADDGASYIRTMNGNTGFTAAPGSLTIFRKGYTLLAGQTASTGKGIFYPEGPAGTTHGYWSGNGGVSDFMIGVDSVPNGWNMSVKGVNNLKDPNKTVLQKIRSSRTNNNDAAYFNVDTKNVYVSTAGVNFANRKLVDFKKTGTTQVVMVADIASLTTGNTIASYWHFTNNGYTNANGTEGDTTFSVDTAVSRNPAVAGNSLLAKFLKPGGDNSVAIIDDNDTYPLSTGSTHRVTTAASADGTTINTSATSAQMLACMELVDDQVTTGVPCSLLSTVDANYFGAQFSDNSNSKVGVFSKDATLRTSMSFTSSHAGTGQYFVDGLQDGVYSVALSGVEQTTCTVGAVVNNLQDDAGCAWDGIAGAYTVIKSGSAPSSANSVLTTGRVSFSGRVK